MTSVNFETILTLQTRRYLLIRLYESCNILVLKENFVLNNLDVAIPMYSYIEPYSAQAQRQFRKTVEIFNKNNFDTKLQHSELFERN